MNCKNCNTELQGAYCHSCGQKNVGQLKMSYVIDNSVGYLLNYDNSFLQTFKKLLIKPEEVIHNYLAGKRSSYFPPFKLLIFTTSILALTFVFIPEGAVEIGLPTDDPNKIDKKFGPVFLDIIGRFFSIALFLSIPASALVNRWLFKKCNYNFAEHLVIATYISSAVNLFSVLTYLVVALPESAAKVGTGIILGASLIYSARAYVKTFKQTLVKGVFKYAVSSLFSTTFYTLEFLAIGVVYYFFFYR